MCAAALDRPPLGLPPGADRVAARVADLPLVRRHHRLRRADLGRPARPRRGGGLHRLAHGGRLRHRVPSCAADRRCDRDGARVARGGVRAPRARRQPGRRHAGGGGRDREVRIRELQVGRRVGGVAGATPGARSASASARTRPSAASTASCRAPSSASSSSPDRRALPGHRQRPPVERRSPDAGRALERARGCRCRRQRDRRQARGLRALGVHRRHRRRDVQLRVRRGQRGEVRGVCSARAHRLHVRRRHHDDLRRLRRGPDLDLGPRLVRPRQVVRPLRQLGAALRRRRAYRHADHEPRGRRRRQLQEGCRSGASRRQAAQAAAAGARGVRRERRRVVPQPVRDRDSARLRGLGGDVPVPRPVRRAQARDGRAALLVLELDALPAADAGLRHRVRGRPLHGDRDVAEPRLRCPPGDGHRLPGRQRLHLHLRQPGHGPGQDRRARGVLPEARGLLLRATGTSCTGSGR